MCIYDVELNYLIIEVTDMSVLIVSSGITARYNNFLIASRFTCLAPHQDYQEHVRVV